MRYKSGVNNKVIYFVFGILFLSCFQIKSQSYPKSFYQKTLLDTTKENTLLLRVENSNFLKNNEYFNQILQGYTLIGYFANPKLVYYPAKNAKIEAGAHFLKYSGINSFSKVIPTLSFHYKPARAVDIIIGTLYGTANHEMIEPLFRHEFYYTDNVENGLQFLFDTEVYKGDIWINWQQFIFKGEDKQEIFTLGLSNKIFLNGQDKKHQLSVPFQSIFIHQGGQINETDKKLVTINNSAVGLNYQWNVNHSFFKTFWLQSTYVSFLDMSTDFQLPYIQGYGVYSTGTLLTGPFNLRIGHWYSDHFITARGHPVFGSMSDMHPGYYEQKRALITCRLLYEKDIIKGLSVGAGFESYSDLFEYTADYWYLFYINFNRDFFIKKFK